MKIKPLSDRVVIEAMPQEEKTKSGIILPGTVNKEKPEEGIVVAVGPGKKTNDGKIITPSIKKGDRVIFTKYGPNEVKVGGKEYLIAREDDILAIIENK